MNINTIKNLLDNIKPGVFTRLTYTSELPLKAEFKKQGYRVVKTNSITTRFGIHYGNIKEVKERDSEPSNAPSEKVSNFSWVIKDNLQYNSKTEKYYLCTYPTKRGRNSSAKYSVYLPDGTHHDGLSDFNHDWVINSYWGKGVTNMMKINIDNIVKIGG